MIGYFCVKAINTEEEKKKRMRMTKFTLAQYFQSEEQFSYLVHQEQGKKI